VRLTAALLTQWHRSSETDKPSPVWVSVILVLSVSLLLWWGLIRLAQWLLFQI